MFYRASYRKTASHFIRTHSKQIPPVWPTDNPGAARFAIRHPWLFLAARHAAKAKAFKAFAERLEAQGKPRKLVLIAVARKLLIALNAMVKENRPFQDIPA